MRHRYVAKYLGHVGVVVKLRLVYAGGNDAYGMAELYSGALRVRNC